MLDLSKPLEAVEKGTERVVPVTLKGRGTVFGVDLLNSFHTKESPAGNTNQNWYNNGRDYCPDQEWYIRNSEPGDMSPGALASINKETPKMMIDVTLHVPGNINCLNPCAPGNRKISNIKALREATRIRDGGTLNTGTPSGDTMGLTAAKAAIETIERTGSVTIRMTPERYGFFMVNRHDLKDYDWQVRSSKFSQTEEVFTI